MKQSIITLADHLQEIGETLNRHNQLKLSDDKLSPWGMLVAMELFLLSQ
ncbi:MAG TPA: hypothetical protein VJZ24_03320 [Thermodesulfovibrionales bacterium]|jgi:hypothetical protein|nr:hypothetical protein [Thermodesulfovibrionales bacterium]